MAKESSFLERLGKYHLVTRLAVGGMGEVWLAQIDGASPLFDTAVVKRILRHLSKDQGFVDRFVNEARLAKQLHHPNIVRIYEFGNDGDDWFIAMEYIHGKSLKALLAACKEKNIRIPLHLAAAWMASILRALDFAHGLQGENGENLGIVHRDVSPDNVLLGFNGSIKLVDFGLAKARESNGVRLLEGKLAYMAPEVFAPEIPVDGRADIYSAGVLLHELLLFERPPCSPLTVAEATSGRTPFSARTELPHALNVVLDGALQIEPSLRWMTAKDMAEALDAFIEEEGRPVNAQGTKDFLKLVFEKEVDSDSQVPVIGADAWSTDMLPAQGRQSRSLKDFQSTESPQSIDSARERVTMPLPDDTETEIMTKSKMPWKWIVVGLIVIAGGLFGLRQMLWTMAPPNVTETETATSVHDAGTSVPVAVAAPAEPDAGKVAEAVPVVEKVEPIKKVVKASVKVVLPSGTELLIGGRKVVLNARKMTELPVGEVEAVARNRKTKAEKKITFHVVAGKKNVWHVAAVKPSRKKR